MSLRTMTGGTEGEGLAAVPFRPAPSSAGRDRPGRQPAGRVCPGWRLNYRRRPEMSTFPAVTGTSGTRPGMRSYPMLLDPDRLPLPEVPRALLREFGTAPDYNAVWRLVTTGRVPSDRRGSRPLV